MDYTPIKCPSVKEREELLRVTCTDILGELVISTLISNGFLTAPASTKYHGDYEGGLFDHSVNVARALEQLTRDGYVKWTCSDPERAPWVVGILHDLCKVDQYRVAALPTLQLGNTIYEYNPDTIIKGHGMKSVIYAQAIGARLTQEEATCIIYHMGAFCPEKEWSDYTRAIHKYPAVLWTHTADMMASHIMEAEDGR